MGATIYFRDEYGRLQSQSIPSKPEPVKHKRTAYLRDWIIVQDRNQTKWVQLYGKVYGHSGFSDGEWVTTSPILKLDIPGGTAETLNTRYVLRDDRMEG